MVKNAAEDVLLSLPKSGKTSFSVQKMAIYGIKNAWFMPFFASLFSTHQHATAFFFFTQQTLQHTENKHFILFFDLVWKILILPHFAFRIRIFRNLLLLWKMCEMLLYILVYIKNYLFILLLMYLIAIFAIAIREINKTIMPKEIKTKRDCPNIRWWKRAFFAFRIFRNKPLSHFSFCSKQFAILPLS